MGQYVMGLASESDVLAVATTAERRCEVAYYLGVRALAEGRPNDAADWFLVVAETGQSREGEMIWALQQLNVWANKPRILAGLQTRKLD
jgi:hypothetical protein